MENLNEYGQVVRPNPNNPNLAQLVLDNEEPNPWITPQKIVPAVEEKRMAFTVTRPITGDQGKRVQLVDKPTTEHHVPAAQIATVQQRSLEQGATAQHRLEEQESTAQNQTVEQGLTAQHQPVELDGHPRPVEQGATAQHWPVEQGLTAQHRPVEQGATVDHCSDKQVATSAASAQGVSRIPENVDEFDRQLPEDSIQPSEQK